MRKIGITDASKVRWWIDQNGWLNIEITETKDANGGVGPEVYDDGGRRQQGKWGLVPAPENFTPTAQPLPTFNPQPADDL